MFSINRLFSKSIQNLENDELRFLPALIEIEEKAPPILPRVVLGTITIFMFTAIAWSSIGQIDVYAVAPGKIMPEGKVKTIQPADAGTVTALYIHDGQKVREGEILLELDPIGSAAEVKSIAERKSLLLVEISRLEAELGGGRIERGSASAEQFNSQELLRSARDSAYFARWSEANSDFQAKLLAEKTAAETLRRMESVVKTTREREEKVRPHIGVVMTRFNYLTLLDNLTQGENDVVNQRNVVRESEQQANASKNRLSQVAEGRRTENLGEIAEKKRSLIALAADERKQANIFSQRTVRAPIDGEIQSVTINGAGAVVAAGQPIASLVPQNAPLIVEAYVSNEDIGYVSVGQSVDLKVDTFPSQKFGSVPATVTQISADAEERSLTPSENAAQQKASSFLPTKAGLAYRAKIRLDRTSLTYDGRSYPLSAGMTVQADIKTDRRRIISFLFNPISKIAEEGIAVR